MKASDIISKIIAIKINPQGFYDSRGLNKLVQPLGSNSLLLNHYLS